MISVFVAITAVTTGSPPPGWKTCGGLPDAYNNTACGANSTCCQQKSVDFRFGSFFSLAEDLSVVERWMPSNGAWGCCPFGADAVCCSNGYTCCPHGTTCQDQGNGYGVVTTCAPANSITAGPLTSGLRVIGAAGAAGDPVIGDQVCKTGPPEPLSTTLKNVLIIGDSVSIGYTPFVATELASVALVQHSPWGGDGGAEETKYGANCIQNLIRAPDGTAVVPDVLMFNWGLHNSLAGNCTAPCDPGQSGPPAEYLPYLRQIVAALKQVGPGKTKLLFAITSPDLCNKPIDDIQRALNTQAAALMAEESIPTVNLYTAITGKCGPVPTAECFGEKGCFCPHCPPGYEWLAESTISPAIRALL